ncbi:Interferon-induced protein with tetratricopeptide repeats 5 [Bagarius yarrelli]|uniref:Interferon-induced protein with tetratricopeptide repeats 5 n=1 Tax=Bagarius yarrelli TaxID=175774 RepID=A0A556VB21_BAGYA|nr:Interferon-induced protein with tetratricopeptide repeats 5 [Bagarius yarrelli]
MLEEQLKKLECHFTWDLLKEDADLNYLEIKFTESLLVESDHDGGFNEKALECLEKAKEVHNDHSYNIVTYGDLAWLHHHLAEKTKANVYLEKLAQIPGVFAIPAEELLREVVSEKAWTFLRYSKKHYIKAKEIFYEALQKEPEDKEWNTGYSFALFHLEGLEIREDKRIPFEESPAVNQLKRALKLDPDNAMIHVFMGLKCYKNKRNAESWKHMKQALDMAPYDLGVILSVAKFMKKEQCYDMALEVLRKMLEKAPDSSQEGARLNPDFVYPQIELALRYAEFGSYAKAREKFQELFARPNLKSADLQAWHRIYGDFNLYRLGSEATAVQHYKEGMALQKVSTEWKICKNRLHKVLRNTRNDVYQIREFMNSLRESP